MKVALFFVKLAMSLTCNSIDGVDESCKGLPVYVIYMTRFAFRSDKEINLSFSSIIYTILKEYFILIAVFSLQLSWPPKYKSDERHIKCLRRDPM